MAEIVEVVDSTGNPPLPRLKFGLNSPCLPKFQTLQIPI